LRDEVVFLQKQFPVEKLRSGNLSLSSVDSTQNIRSTKHHVGVCLLLVLFSFGLLFNSTHSRSSHAPLIRDELELKGNKDKISEVEATKSVIESIIPKKDMLFLQSPLKQLEYTKDFESSVVLETSKEKVEIVQTVDSHKRTKEKSEVSDCECDEEDCTCAVVNNNKKARLELHKNTAHPRVSREDDEVTLTTRPPSSENTRDMLLTVVLPDIENTVSSVENGVVNLNCRFVNVHVWPSVILS